MQTTISVNIYQFVENYTVFDQFTVINATNHEHVNAFRMRHYFHLINHTFYSEVTARTTKLASLRFKLDTYEQCIAYVCFRNDFHQTGWPTHPFLANVDGLAHQRKLVRVTVVDGIHRYLCRMKYYAFMIFFNYAV